VPRLGGYLSGQIRSVQANSIQAGLSSSADEERKTRKYSDIVPGVNFSPFAVKTSGVWGEHALDLVTEISRRIAAATHDPRSPMFLRQPLSVAVQCAAMPGFKVKVNFEIYIAS